MKDNACMYVSTPRTGFPSLLSKRSLENCSAVLQCWHAQIIYILKHVYLQCLVLRCRILGLQFLSLDLTLSSAPEFTICHPFLSAYLLLLSLSVSLSLSLSLISSLLLLLLLLLLTYKIIRGPRNLIQASPQYSDVSPKLIHRVRSITDGIKLYFDQGHNIHCGWTEIYWSDFLVRGRICEIGTIFKNWWH